MITIRNHRFIHNERISSRIKKTVGLLAGSSLLALTAFLLLSTAPGAQAASCAPSGTTYGTDTMSVTAPTTSNYYVWVRMQDPSTTANSIDLQLDGSTCYIVGGSTSVTAGAWTWVNYDNGSTADVMEAANLASGSHSLELIGTDPGVEIDNVLLLANANCVPSGTGTNCTGSQSAPSAPTLSATVTSPTKVNLSWTQSTESGSGLSVEGYYVYRGSTLIDTITSPTTLTYTDTVQSGSPYTYTVAAYDNSSPPATTSSNPVTVTPGLTAPTGVTATAANPYQVNLSWNAATDSGGTLAGYNILRETGNSGTYTNVTEVASNVTSYQDTTASPGTSYSYIIQSVDSSSSTDTASSSPVSVTTPALPPPPSAPTNVTVSAPAYNSVVLNWTNSIDTGGDGVGGYYIIRNGVNIYQARAVATSYNDTSVQADTTYTYQIEAFDSTYPKDVSPPASTTPVTVTTPSLDTQPPTQPTNLKATAVSDTQINLSWTASTDKIGVEGYTVYRNTDVKGRYSALGTTATNSYGDTSLKPSTTHTYYVIAYDSAGDTSEKSATASATTLAGSITVTVEGTVTSASTNKPISGAFVTTGKRAAVGKGTGQAATDYTNSAGQYVLSNIKENRTSPYTFSASGYTTYTVDAAFPTGTATLNEALSPN